MPQNFIDKAVGFVGVSDRLQVRDAAVSLHFPDDPIVRLPMERIRDEHDVKLISEFASACSLVFVEMPGASAYQATSASLRSGASVVAELPAGLSLRELRQLQMLATEARATVAVSRPVRFQDGYRELLSRGRADIVWADLRAGRQVSRSLVLGDFVDVVIELIRGRSVQRIDTKTSVDVSSGAETIAISIRFQNSGMSLIHLCVDDRFGADVSSEVRVSGSWGSAEAHIHGRPFGDSVLLDETEAIVNQFRLGEPPPATVSSAIEVLRIVEQIMARLRQHDSLAI